MKNQEITKRCSFCGEMFIALRQTAKFCSNTCRTKANNQRRENEIIEAQKAKAQAELDELKRKAAEVRKLNKAKKEADYADKRRLDEIELEIQAEIDAFELTAKNRGIISIVEMLGVRAVAKEKQLVVDEERKKISDQFKLNREIKAAKERNEISSKDWIELFENISKLSKKSENPPSEPDPIIPPNLPQKLDNSLLPKDPNSPGAGLKSNNWPKFDGMNGSGISSKPGVTPPTGNIPSIPTKKESILKSAIDHVWDTIDFS